MAPNALSIVFTDSAGGTATLPGTAHLGTNGLNARFADLIVPVAAIREGGADPARLAAIELKVATPMGTLVIDDLRFE
jgi:hypothetical protein